MVKLIPEDYKIVNKKETKVLIRTLDECRKIYQAWSILSQETQKQLDAILDDEINMKLQKCFDFYNRKYNITIETGYGEMKDIEINIANICETLKTWEE